MNTKPKRKYGEIKSGAETSAGTNDAVFDKFFSPAPPPGAAPPPTVAPPSAAPADTLAPPASAETPAISASPRPLSAPAPSATPAPSAEVEGRWAITNDVTDRLWRLIRDPYAQSVLVQLLRLSWGYHRDWCVVGLPKLAERCGFHETQARKGKRILLGLGVIEETGQDNTNKDNDLRGPRYRILLTPPPSVKIAPSAAPPNKEKLSKNIEKASVCDRCQDHPGWFYPDPANKKRGMLPCDHRAAN